MLKHGRRIWHLAWAIVWLAQQSVMAGTLNVPVLDGQVPVATDSITTLGTDLFGDKVNLYNGALQFEQTDTSLPGNHELPVALTRQYSPGRDPLIRGQAGDWDLVTPRIGGVFSDLGWVTGSGGLARCSNYTPPSSFSVGPGVIQTQDFHHGVTLTIPDRGSQEVLKRAANFSDQPLSGGSYPAIGNLYPLVTKDLWQIGCLSTIQNGLGQGFTAVSPDGVSYRFDWMASRHLGNIRKGDAAAARTEYMLMASELKDRFGNWVRYSYSPSSPMLLTRIEASDGRVITLQYVAGRLASVNDGTRTFSYLYDGAGNLSVVRRPDGSQWAYSLAGMLHPTWDMNGEGSTCNSPGVFPATPLVGTMVHPSGATGRFTTAFVSHGRTDVTRACWYVYGTSGQTTGAVWRHLLRSQSLLTKEVSGPGLPNLTWQYNYASAWSWTACPTCRKTVTVTAPDGSQTRYSFGNRWRINEGQLLQLDEGWNPASGTALRSTGFRYRDPDGTFPDRFGTSDLATTDWLGTGNRPEDRRVVAQQGTTFTHEVDPGSSGFDRWARPIRTSAYSSLGFRRSFSTVYRDNPSLWVIGQTDSVTETTSGRVPEAHEYDAATAMPRVSRAFGRTVHTLQFRNDGTLETRDEGAGRVTAFSGYMRGKPQQALFADGTVAIQGVNNLGNVFSVTNEAGTAHSIGHDLMGRPARIDYPAGDPVAYHPKLLSFQQSASPQRGLAQGHWRQTITNGNAVTVRWFDALWRVRLSLTYDATDEAGTSSYIETRYDAGGRKSFESHPRRFIATIDDPATSGAQWVYDGIGRQVQQSIATELGAAAVTTTAYESGYRRRVTSPRGAVSVFSFQAFDSPVEDHIWTVQLPEGAQLTIDRDVFGKPRSITRSGPWSGGTVSASRRYVYDVHERLCKTIEPESGATVQQYDAANNLAWRASGLGLPGTENCDQGSVPGSRMVSHGYDLRNRLLSTTFGDGSPGIARSYSADGLLVSLSSAGGVWSYTYNRRRLMDSESLNDGSSYGFSYGINAHGHVESLRYPHGLAVSYRPDALGRPREVSGFARNATHHPNGAIAGYTLGNNIAHTTQQNLRGLPEQWRDHGVAHDTIAYDLSGNVTAINDLQLGLNHRGMAYDGLDRLVSANGPWGPGNFAYDGLDNLRSSTLGGRSLLHQVDPATNRLVALSGSFSLAMGYDANGNISQRGAQSFSFDIANRLSAAPGRASYLYDGHGRRFRVQHADGSWRLQLYNHAGQLLLTQHSAHGITAHLYLGNRLVAEHSPVTGAQYLHTDLLGSPVARTNPAGQLVSRTRYEPYGATVAGSTIPSGFGFTGHVNDADTGLVYMQQRYYDPLAGRFLSVDPVTTDAKTGDFFGRYHYANNNPYKFVDPDGRAGALAACAAGPVGCAVGVVVTIAVGAKALSDTAKVLQSTSSSSSGSSPSGGAQDAPTSTTDRPTQEWIYGPKDDSKINPDGSTKPNTWTTPDKYPDQRTAQDKLDPFKPAEGRRPATIPTGTDVKRGKTPGGEAMLRT